MLLYTTFVESEDSRSKFESIYTEYHGMMYRVATRILGDSKDTEDVVHEAFLKIFEILDEIQQVRSPKTRNLVVTIVERKAIDLYRRRRRQPQIPLDDEHINVPSPSQIETIPAYSDLAKAIAMLPTKNRELLLLKYDWGYSEKEIAQLLNLNPEAVKKTIQRTKQKLKNILREEEYNHEHHG